MKKAVISGGAGGIGSKIVEKFINEGFFCYVIDIDSVKCQELSLIYGEDKCKTFQWDVTDEEDIQSMKEFFVNETEIHSVVTLAGRALDGEWERFESQSLSLLKDSISVNLQGHMNVISALYGPLKKSVYADKNVVMISSINALSGYGLPAYSAAKSGLLGFMNALVKEFGEDGIRINTVSPGTVVTPATQHEPKDFDALQKGCAIKRFTNSEEVAKCVYAVSNELTSMTGQNVIIDSGQLNMQVC